MHKTLLRLMLHLLILRNINLGWIGRLAVFVVRAQQVMHTVRSLAGSPVWLQRQRLAWLLGVEPMEPVLFAVWCAANRRYWVTINLDSGGNTAPGGSLTGHSSERNAGES